MSTDDPDDDILTTDPDDYTDPDDPDRLPAYRTGRAPGW